MTTMNPFPRQDYDHVLSTADAVQVRVVALSWENELGTPRLVLQLDTLLDLEHVAQALDTSGVTYLRRKDILSTAGPDIRLEDMLLPSGTVVRMFSPVTAR